MDPKQARPPIEFVVRQDEDGKRLELMLRDRLPLISRGSIRRLLDRKLAVVDGVRQKKGFRVRTGQRILLAAAAHDERPQAQSSLKLEVIAETAALIVINKPAGIPSHPLLPGETDTVANGIAARYPECIDASVQAREAGLVHRLDGSTSGVLVAARTRAAYTKLRRFFSVGLVEKRYLALVHGTLDQAQTVDLAIETDPDDRRRVRTVAPPHNRGQPAHSEIIPVETGKQFTLVRVISRTGRRHQVRIHLSALGFPLAGDVLYGGAALEQTGALLHAEQITLEEKRYIAELPKPRAALVRKLLERS